MTTRRYKCKSCGEFEQQERITDEPLQVCPKCSAPVHQRYFTEPLMDVWISDSKYVSNGTIHRFLQKGGTTPNKFYQGK